MSSSTEPVIYNVDQWISDNSKFFLPPVCNKMMHNDGQMKVFYVGGPNQRKDYHIEEGEELFYMVKGNMVLKVVEHGKHKDIPIREGEVFLLPGKIAHSPQRQLDTVGLVIERERDETELDGLRYFIEENGVPLINSLYEEWFHCEDLGSQLGSIIRKFFASEQYKTGKPIPGSIPDNPPITLDSERTLEKPFCLKEWIDNHRTELSNKGTISLFDDSYQFQVNVCGKGETSGGCAQAETWIWQIEGNSTATVNDKEYSFAPQDTMLVRVGQKYTLKIPEGSIMLVCYQDPARKSTKT